MTVLMLVDRFASMILRVCLLNKATRAGELITGEKEREELWRRMLADVKGDAQLERVHFTELARRLQMSGGYIRNAVLRAAYQAAASGAPITTTLLRGAAELVLRDAGKVI